MRVLLKFFTKLFTFGVAFCVAMGIGMAMYVSTLLPSLPTVEQIRQIPLNIPLRIYSNDGKLIGEYGNERRIPLTLDQAPPLLIDALLATEDDRFYHHTGVDFPGLARAAISNVMSQSKGQGASTITMQVARNFFLNPEKTYTRKLKEILLAFNMERALTKDEILELYLNKIFLGHRSYGFAAAAQVYYGEDLQNLNVPKIAMLAGLPKAPSRDNPISNPIRAAERRAYVLKRLNELGKIDELSYKTASAAPVTAKPHVADVDIQAPYISEMARQLMYERFGPAVYEKGFSVTVTINSEYQLQANKSLRKGLLNYDMRHGYREKLGNIDLTAIDQKNRKQIFLETLDEYPISKELVPAIVTEVGKNSFSAFTQKGETIAVNWEQITWAREYRNTNAMGPELNSVSEILKSGDIIHVREYEEGKWMLSQLPNVSGALVSLDAKSGAILALTGGFDYYLSKFNRATQALRQLGSNIKPFIYSAAIEHGFSPGSLVSAAPIVVENDLEGVWRPENYSKKFFGPTRLRKALSLSLNLVSVRLLRAIGMEKTRDHLERFGFERKQLPANLSLALGSTQITPLDLASRFAVLANGGYSVEPYLIEKIEDPDGNLVALPDKCADCAEESVTESINVVSNEETEQLSEEEILETEEAVKLVENGPVISPQNVFLTQSMMKQVILSGTGRRALALNRFDLAGKTGTTNDFKDAWFSGFNPDVTTTVFVGFDEPKHLGRRESGASAALPIWVDFMGRVLKDYPEVSETIPENITTRFINKDNGKVTSSDDPDGYTEYYAVGTAPSNLIETNVIQTEGAEDQSVTESLF